MSEKIPPLFKLNDEALTRAMAFLDNINAEEGFDALLEQGASTGKKTYLPKPGVCIKLYHEITKEKVFLNICTTDKLPGPVDMSKEDLMSAISYGRLPEVPMSILQKLVRDKSGTLCPTYDAAINATFFQKCLSDACFMLWTISIATHHLRGDFDELVSKTNFVILKHRKVMGELDSHKMVEMEKPVAQVPKVPKAQKPLIEVIPSYQHKKNQHTPSKQKAGCLLLRHPAKGTPTLLIGLFTMPKRSMGKNISVLLYDDRIVVEAFNDTIIFDIDLPYKIQAGNAKSFLDTNLGVLRVNLPIESEQGCSGCSNVLQSRQQIL